LIREKIVVDRSEFVNEQPALANPSHFKISNGKAVRKQSIANDRADGAAIKTQAC
jgi:hypothetical protein